MRKLDLNEALQLLITLRAISDGVIDVHTPFLLDANITQTGVNDNGDIATMSAELLVYPASLYTDHTVEKPAHYKIEVTISMK